MPLRDNQVERAAPVTIVDTGSAHDDPRAPQDGIALCLSGGGYRAMLFHLGALWRLNEIGYLPKLARISSVSGGSITAGLLGLKWARLAFDAQGVSGVFEAEVVQPIRALAARRLTRARSSEGSCYPAQSPARATPS
jgi:NTE family protein